MGSGLALRALLAILDVGMEVSIQMRERHSELLKKKGGSERKRRRSVSIDQNLEAKTKVGLTVLQSDSAAREAPGRCFRHPLKYSFTL